MVGERTDGVETWEVVLAGAGGQGLLLAGTLLGEAACLYEGRNAATTQSYGVATRGGFSRAEVVISNAEIAYPLVRRPDVVVALTQGAYDRYCSTLGPGALLIFDDEAVHGGRSAATEKPCPIVGTAYRLNAPGNANMVALGVLSRLTKVVSLASLLAAAEARFSPIKGRGAKLQAIRAGYDLAAAGPSPHG